MFEQFPNDFNWGDDPTGQFQRWVKAEYYGNVYEYWRSIRPGDIVVDIGASVGPMTYSALLSGATKVYAVEPSQNYCGLIAENTKNVTTVNSNLVVVNSAICEKYQDDVNVFANHGDQFNSTTFGDLIDFYNINKINFLKIDCEGGEYDILNEKYYYYLRHCVDFIACEMHYRTIKNGRSKFQKFRDGFLKRLPRKSYKFYDIIDGKRQDATDWLLTDEGMDHLMTQSEFMLYIKNR